MDKGQITDLYFNQDSSFNLDLTASGQQASISQGFFLTLLPSSGIIDPFLYIDFFLFFLNMEAGDLTFSNSTAFSQLNHLPSPFGLALSKSMPLCVSSQFLLFGNFLQIKPDFAGAAHILNSMQYNTDIILVGFI